MPDLLAVVAPLDLRELQVLIGFLQLPNDRLDEPWAPLAEAVSGASGIRHAPKVLRRVVGDLRATYPELDDIVRAGGGERGVREKLFYELCSGTNADPRAAFMNLGFGAERPFEALYSEVLRDVPVRRRVVVEAGSGRGGGAAWVARTLQPETFRGVDPVRANLAFCRRTHRETGLTFALGTSEALGTPDESVDVVLSVEASHAYPTLGGFLDEAARTLRPGGLLAWADIRNVEPEGHVYETVADLERQIARSAFRIEHLTDLTEGVVVALERHGPAQVRRWTRAFQGLRDPWAREHLCAVARQVWGSESGSWLERFRDGASIYLHRVLRKQA